MTISCASLPSLVLIKISKGLFMPHFSLKIAHLSCFRILSIYPILTSKVVHENSKMDIGQNALRETLS
jgi:hypothetical protein